MARWEWGSASRVSRGSVAVTKLSRRMVPTRVFRCRDGGSLLPRRQPASSVLRQLWCSGIFLSHRIERFLAYYGIRRGRRGAGRYFVVERRDGLIYEYGNTPDSRNEPIGIGGGQILTASSWGLNEIRDRAGNLMRFVYQEDGVDGVYRISEILYATNTAQGIYSPYKVSFVYETTPRPDTLYGYRFGNPLTVDGRFVETRRLDRIDVFHGTRVIRRYELDVSGRWWRRWTVTPAVRPGMWARWSGLLCPNDLRGSTAQ